MKRFLSRVATKIIALSLVVLLVGVSILFWSNQAKAAVTLVSWTGGVSGPSYSGEQTVLRASNGTMIAFYAVGISTSAVHYSTSTDGTNWSADTAVPGGSFGGFSVAIDGSDNVYLAYSNPNPQVWVNKLPFSGGVLGSSTTVLTFSGNYSNPTLAINNVNTVVLNVTTPTSTTVSYLSSDGGSSWSSPYPLSSAAVVAPIIAIGQGFYTLNNTNTILKDTSGSGAWTSTSTAVSSATGNISLASTSSDYIDMIYPVTGGTVSYQRYTISTNSLGGITGLPSSVSSKGYSLAAAPDGQMWAFYTLGNVHAAYVHYSGTWDGSATDLGANPGGGSSQGVSSVAYIPSSGFLPVIWVNGKGGGPPGYDELVFSLNVTIGSANSAPAAPTLSLPGSGATNQSALPQFQLRTTDADNDYLRYEIMLYQSDCSTSVRDIDQTADQTGWADQDQQTNTAYTGSSTISSSTMATHNYQTPALSASTTYCWKARAKDPGGSNTWGSYSATQTFTTGVVGPSVQIQGGVEIRGGTSIGN